MKVGVISDTHGLLRPEAVAALQGCEQIIHAGDIGSPEILQQLAQIAPLYVVRGDKIVHRLSQTACTVAAARQKLQNYIEDALIVPQADLVDIDIIAAVHLIHAIREAEGRGPTPPAANAMAVPERAAA